MNYPLVSIIIPVYNAEMFLAETINSALGQTWPNKEIIIIDDGSTDNSLSIAQNYSDNRNIKIVTQTNNGASAARNAGLKQAKGDYIQFLDADDLLSADKIYQQVINLEHNSRKVAICSTIHFYENFSDEKFSLSTYEERFLFNDDDPVHFLVNLLGGYSENGAMIAIHSWLTPKCLIHEAGLWNENLTLNDDGEYFCRVLLKSSGVIKTNGFNYYRKSRLNNTLSSLKSYNSFKSAIESTDLIRAHLKNYLNAADVYNCFYKSYTGYKINCFPDYKHLSKQCDSKASSILQAVQNGGKVKIRIGGKIIDFIANNISWKLARYLQTVAGKLNKVSSSFILHGVNNKSVQLGK